MSLYEQMAEIFFATRERVGRQLIIQTAGRKQAAFGPWRDRRNTESGAEWSFRELTAEMVAMHVAGELLYRGCPCRLQTYGVSGLAASVWTALDLDVTEHGGHSNQPQHLDTTADALAAGRRAVAVCRELGVSGWMEITKSGGIRVWMFFAAPLPAADANAFGRLVALRAGLHRATEVFPNTLREFAAPVLLPYAGVAPEGRQVVLTPGTYKPMPLGEFVASARAARADVGHVLAMVIGAVAAGEVKRLTSSERMGGSGVAPVTDAEAGRRWQAVLDGCLRLREIVERAEGGQALSYSDWALRLLPHLRPLGEWGHAEFHRLSAFDSRYAAADCEDKFDSVDGAPTRCDKMDCARDPQRDCGLPPKNVSPAYFSAKALGQAVKSDRAVKTKPIAAPEVFHGLLGEIVNAVDPHTESDRMAVLISLLIGFGNVIGRSAFFQIEATRHYANLNAVVVGKSAVGRKGTSLGHALRFLRELDENWAGGRLQSGLSSGEGLICAVRDPLEKDEPIRGKDKQITGYQTVIADRGVDDKRLLVIESEFAKVLSVIQREGNTLSVVVRQGWDSGDLRVMTKQAQTATGAHISIVGHITQEELLREMNDTEVANGFANRFLWIWASRSKMLPEGGRLHSMDLQALCDRLRGAAAFANGVGEMHRDDDAREMWREVYPILTREEPGLLGSLIARGAPLVVRMSLIYALLDQSQIIRPIHLQAALAVWQYAEDSARFIFGGKLGDPMADEILHALRNRPKGMTQTDIRDLFHRNPKGALYSDRLQSLQEQGFIRSVHEETGGRPALRWFMV